MPRIRYAYLPGRVFENIDNDNTCSEAIRDDAIKKPPCLILYDQLPGSEKNTSASRLLRH